MGRNIFVVSSLLKLDLTTFKSNLDVAVKKLGVTARTMEKTFIKASKGLDDYGKKFSILGGIAAGALGYGMKKIIDQGGGLSDLSKQLGMTTEALSELNYAAGMSGISMEGLTKGIGRMQKYLAGGKLDAIKALGLDPEKLKRAAPDEAFTRIVDAIGKVNGQNQRMNLATAIFGKGGGEFVRLAKDGAAGLAALREEARKVGASMDSKTAQTLDEIGDKTDKLKAQVAGFGKGIGYDLLPMVNGFLNIAGKWMDRLVQLRSGHRDLFSMIEKTGVVFTVAGAGIGGLFIGMGKLFRLIADGVSGWKNMLGWISRITTAKKLATAATVADTIATEANTAAKIANAGAGAAGGGAGLLGKAGAVGAAALVGWGIGSWAGEKMYDAGWANEGAGWGIGGAVLGGMGRKIGDWWGGRNAGENLGERTRQLMDQGRVRGAGAAPAGGGVDGENKRLMEEQNGLIRQQNELLRQATARNNMVGMNKQMVPVL